MNEIYGFVSVGIEGERDERFLVDHISDIIEHERFSCKKVGQGYFSRWNVFSERSPNADLVTAEILNYLRSTGSLFAATIFVHKKVSISIYEKTDSCTLIVPSELTSQIGIHGFDLEVAHYNTDI